MLPFRAAHTVGVATDSFAVWRNGGSWKGRAVSSEENKAIVRRWFLESEIEDMLAEGWANFDALGMMMQIGAIPMPAQGGAISQA
jgi:hypothetical protein